MLKQLSWLIGLRYVRSRQEQGFFSLVSIFSFAAMTLGVAALIIVMSVMNGFDREIKQRILNVIPHLTLEYTTPSTAPLADLAELRQMPGVSAASLYIDGQAMLSAQYQLQGISLQGIDPQYPGLDILADSMITGALAALEPGEYGIILGALLARNLRIVTGDTVLLTLPQMTLTPAGAFPRVKQLKVVGIYQVGAQVDNGIGFVHFADAQKLYRLGDKVEGIRLSVDDPFDLDRVRQQLTEQYGDKATVATWQESLKTLFAAIKMEKTVVGLLLGVIIAVAGFNIVASLVLMVASKRKDIAVLRAMGASSALVTGVFRVQGVVTGLSGVMLGGLIGCLASWRIGELVSFLEKITGATIFDPQVYFISQLPADLQLADVVSIMFIGVLISVLATLYPAWRAGQVSPAEVLRYDH